MSENPKTPQWEELFDLLKRLERPPGSRTPLPSTLTAAVSSGDLAMVELFLARGSALDEKTMGSSSPLAAAATAGRLDMVELLLSKGGDPNPPGLFSSPLDSAAAFGHAQVVRRLLAAGIDPRSPSAELALFRAAAAGRFECVKILVDSGVSRSARSGPTSAADMAEQMGHAEVADFLAGKPVDVEAATARERSEAERRAAASARAFASLSEPPLAGEERQRAVDRICAIVRSGALQGRLDDRGPQREPALNLAAEHGLVPAVEALLEAGANPNVATRGSGAFPLYFAASQGESGIVGKLLAAGADPNQKTNIGFTALIEAAKWGDPGMVRLLLEAGADPRPRTSGGETAITSVRGPFRDEIVKLLKEAARALDRADKKKGAAPASEEGALRSSGKTRGDVRQRRGASDFLKYVNQGQPEWSLVAAEGGVEEVAAVLAGLHQATVWEKDVAGRPVEAAPRFTFAVRLHGHGWTLAPLSVGWAQSEDFEAARRDARELSQRLGTRALAFFGEDTACTIGYELFERGERVESVEWEDGGDLLRFESTRRQKPAKVKDTWKSIDRDIAELGLYVLPCALDSDGRNARLELSGIPLGAVERADYLGFAR